MAFPSILGTSKGINGSNTTSHSVTLPASISAGELIVVMMAFDGTPTVSPPDSQVWGGGLDRNITSGTPTASVWFKRADGTEGGTTITFTSTASEQSSYVAMRLSVDTLITFEGAGEFLTGSSANSTFNLAGSTLRPAYDYKFISFRAGDSTTQPTAPSSGYTLVDSQAGGTGNAAIYVQSRDLNTTGNTAGALTVATEQWVTMAFGFYFEPTYIRSKEQVLRIFNEQSPSSYAGFSFRSNGLNLKEVTIQLFKGSTALTLYIELYAHSGTFRTAGNTGSGVPTGSALATSSSVTITGTNDYGSVDFTFPTAYQTTNGTDYFIVIRDSTNAIVNVSAYQDTLYGEGNAATFSGGTWTALGMTMPPYYLFEEVVTASNISESISVTESQDSSVEYSVSNSESVSVTDDTDETLQTTGSISESISVTEEQASGGATISDSVSESISVTESQNRTLVVSVSDSESISPSDTTDETATLVRSISESVSATDTTDETAVLVRSISESVSITETQNRTATYTTSISESVSVTESQSAGVQYIVSVSESISVTETQNSSYALLVSVSESVSITETQNGLIAIGVSISESVSATETQNRTFNTTASASESVSVTDAQDRTAVTNVSLNESIGISESQNRTAVLINAVSESVSVTETQFRFYQTSTTISESVFVNHSQDGTAQATGQYLGTAKVYITLTQGSVTSSMKTGKAKQDLNKGTIKTNIGL